MKILNSKFFSALLLFVIFWLGSSLINLNGQRNVVNQEIKSYDDKISEAQKNKDSLSQFLKNIENPAFLEREARIKYNYRKADEDVTFVYPDHNSKSASRSFADILKVMPNWKKWGYWLRYLLK